MDLFARKRQYFLYDQFADKRKNRKRRCFFIWNDRSSNGIMENVMIIYISFMIAFVVALYLIILRKKNKETAFPFAPCIGLAYFLVLAAG